MILDLLIVIFCVLGAVLLAYSLVMISRAGAERRRSEAQLRQITDHLPALIAYIDSEQRFRFHNKAYEEFFALGTDQIRGRSVREVLGDTVYESMRPHVEKVLSGQPVRYQFSQENPHGELREYEAHFFPRPGAGEREGNVVGFYALVTDITELKRIDRMKSEFVSIVSHELRTPLTSIRGSLGLVAGGVAGVLPEAAKSLVDIAKNNCERLIRLINDILDSDKIESGKMAFTLEVVELKALLEQVLAANQGFAGQHQVSLSLRAEDELCVRADADRLNQVITNLVSNAVKFSPPGKVVEVRLARALERVRVAVRDEGPGIPEEFRSRIFQKFSQADSSDARLKGGTGLGLNISKAIIERLGGSLGFTTELGAGSTFFFELPEAQKASAVAEPRSALIVALRDEAQAPGTRRAQVLHVEDDPDVRRVTAAIAQDFATFEFAATLQEARALLKERSFDLVLLDIALPDGSGWDLLADLKALARVPPLVVFSATEASAADGARAAAFLVKSRTTNEELLATIHEVLEWPGR